MKTQFTFYLSALLLALASLGCNRLDKEARPSPSDTATVLPTFTVRADSTGRFSMSLDTLAVDRSQPFTLTTEGFMHGRIVIEGTERLAYRAHMTTGWAKDSGTIRITQNERTRERKLVVFNILRPGHLPLSCDTLSGISRNITSSGATLDSTNLPGMQEVGARIDSIWGYMATCSLNSNKTTITYAPIGGDAFPYTPTADKVYYRVKRPNNGGCYQSAISFFYPDSCTHAQARQDVINAPAVPFFINPSDLVSNDANCAGTPSPDGHVQLTIQPYTPNPLKVLTKHGAISDTIINSIQQLYYRRFNPAARADTFTYYLNEEGDSRISRAYVILNLP